MKKLRALFAAGMIPAMMSATDFSLQMQSPWKKTADNAASIDYQGSKAWPKLKIKPGESLKPNSLYRITFEAKSSAPEQIFCGFEPVLNGKKQRIYYKFFPSANFKKYTFYFNSGKTPETGIPNIYFNPTKPFQMEIKDIKLDEMTEESLYGKNLLPCGDFEEGNPFHPYTKAMNDRFRIVDSADFMCGENTLLLDCHSKSTSIISDSLPAIPGKEIAVKFYAKSDNAAQVRLIIDFGNGFGGKHYYLSAKFRLEKEWKEFSHKFKISEDFNTYPVLHRSLANLRLGGQSISDGTESKIFLDSISYTILK